jgi:hypothetical protein
LPSMLRKSNEIKRLKANTLKSLNYR